MHFLKSNSKKAEESNIKVKTVGDNINHWKGNIPGPVKTTLFKIDFLKGDTVYEGGLF